MEGVSKKKDAVPTLTELTDSEARVKSSASDKALCVEKKDSRSRDLDIRTHLPEKGHLDWLLWGYSGSTPPPIG